MRNWGDMSMFHKIILRNKSSFPTKVNVPKPHDLCSRTRVCEGSPKKKEIKKEDSINPPKICLGKKMDEV